MTRTQKYKVPVVGIKAVKVSDDDPVTVVEEELTREDVELTTLELQLQM